jgi:spermidine synthase
MSDAGPAQQSGVNRPLLFSLFYLSGFCGLLYQVVWTRMAFASFGITSQVLSIVISVFMLGLSIGSWAGGRFVGVLTERSRVSGAVFYAMAELLIGIGAFVVPILFARGERLLFELGETNSLSYLSLSAAVLAMSLLPWCVCMGATFPLMMAYARERAPSATETFSYLYVANVLGAMMGTLLTAIVLVEVLGFQHTLWVAAAVNISICGLSASLGFRRGKSVELLQNEATQGNREQNVSGRASRRLTELVLFSTGFTSMAMEVVWVRSFAPVIKTQVYSFAFIVAAYLAATFGGSLLYRRHLRRHRCWRTCDVLVGICAAAFLPIILNDPRIVYANWADDARVGSVLALLASICPFCALLGYLTPGLVDEYAGGAPRSAGKAYALNVLGCILGPLVASYLLLPLMSEHVALLLLAVPLVLLSVWASRGEVRKRRWILGLAGGAMACSLLVSRSYEETMLRGSKVSEVHRDYAASAVAVGEGMDRKLLVNGIGMTVLTPATKFMAHLPLGFHRGKPQTALIICFGMGTSFRSAMSWGLETTAVELVPSVPKTFAFFHDDGAQLLASSRAHVVIDDGRRFLSRSREKFDVIIIDPPPPIEAAGSSLLYSEGFYDLAKLRLQTNGILQTWFPDLQGQTMIAVVRSLRESFPYVKCFVSVEKAGIHLLASMQPIDALGPADIAARLPPAANRDLLEWSGAPSAAAWLEVVLRREVAVDGILGLCPRVRITDDQPFNEYYLLRHAGVIHPER